MDRRGFIKNAGRGSLLAGLAAITGILISRQQVVRDQDCSNGFQCKNCRKLTDCELPEATQNRDHGTGG